VTLDPRDEPRLVALALDAAREAAKILAPGFRHRPTAEHKGAIDLVTEFDRASEAYLTERLARETGFACIGEEAVGKRGRYPDAPTWYVDPLDGTTNFVHGHPFYCVSIGLTVGAAPRLGVVFAPALALTWTGIAGQSATRNGEPCRVSAVDAFGEAMLGTGFPYDRKTSADNNFDAFVALKKQVQAVRRCGSAAIDLCFVGDGTYDGYWERKLHPWDIAAGSAIVLGAGGQLSSFDGMSPDLLQGHLVATNGKIHDALVRALQAVRPGP
jgi:myo-inositol-1(or 4)-monophosphatase